MHRFSEEVSENMKATKALRAAVVFLVTLMSACATTDTTSTTWTDPNAPGYGAYPPPPGYVRGGQVQSVQEVVQRTQGQPAAGAVAGALIGSFLFGGHGPGSALAGAAGGAAVGAAASSGSSETRTYHVVVRFDDGGYGTFVYAGYSPFGPGQRVVLTPQGLAAG
jgi:outer membrane lipoprotein SlyB